MIQKFFMTLLTGLMFSQVATAGELLLQRNYGKSQCFISSNYVGLAYNGEEVDGRSVQWTSEIPGIRDLLSNLEHSLHVGLALLPDDPYFRQTINGPFAMVEGKIVVLAIDKNFPNDPGSKLSRKLIDFMDVNCTP